MFRPGPRLIAPKTAAWLLAAYLVLYAAWFFVRMGTAFTTGFEYVFERGTPALLVTSVLAALCLPRLSALPAAILWLVSLVFLAACVFFGAGFVDICLAECRLGIGSAVGIAAATGIPALLAGWLAATFAIAAVWGVKGA